MPPTTLPLSHRAAGLAPWPRPSDPATRNDRLALAAVLLALAVWGVLFIARTSFTVEGIRFFVLFDDAMISMAYARNVAEGEGLVWVPGRPPVEGFTNPLWTALMVPVNALPLPPSLRSGVIQAVSLLLLMATVWRVRALLRRHFGADHARGWLPAAILTAFCYSLAYWALLGMEAALQALLTVLAVEIAYDIVFADRDRHLALFAVFAVAYLTRMDMSVMILVVGGWVAWYGGFRRRAVARWAAGAVVLAAVVVGYQIFREIVFGASLPNTYYLKVGSVPFELRWTRGAAKAWDALRESLLAVLAVVAAVVSGWRRGRTQLPGLLLAAYFLYSVWVGGDAWELPEVNVRANRFIVFVLPLAFVALADGVRRLADRIRSPVRRGVAAATVAAVLLLLVDGLVVSEFRRENWRNVLLVDRPLHVGSHGLVLGRLLRFEDLVAPGARVVVYWAGLPAYFCRYDLLDAYGYNDATTARRPPHAGTTWRSFVPGHDKADPADLLSRHPDAFFQLWDIPRIPSRWPRHHLRDLGYAPVEEFWLRRDSPYLLSGALGPSATTSTQPAPAGSACDPSAATRYTRTRARSAARR